jgi:hypothetical protein
MSTIAHLTYYRFEYRYGAATLWQTPRGALWHPGTLHAFVRRADRDAWVAARRTDYQGNPGFREAVTRAWAIKNGNLARSGADEYQVDEVKASVINHRKDV